MMFGVVKIGVNWLEESYSANYESRQGHTTLVFDNHLWIIGGYNYDQLCFNDVIAFGLD